MGRNAAGGFNLDFSAVPSGAASHDFPTAGKNCQYDVAGVVAFLLSDEAEFITGQVLSPNGGAYI